MNVSVTEKNMKRCFFLFLRHTKPFLPEDGGMGRGGLMFLSEEAALQTDSGVSALPSG